MDAFKVFPYTTAQLVELLSEKSQASVEAISAKSHKDYFDGYFAHLNAQTILVEESYVDRDFLDDFSAYYVRCFTTYHRFTSRLHFFNLSFSRQDFLSLLKGDETELSHEILQNSYLGFVVVKNLPQTIIGRTCLKTYNHEDRRYFPISKPYNANIFGISLSIESLAFQEQDSVVAACATSALWSCFQGTGESCQHFIPSPVAITKVASASIPQLFAPADIRTLPNHGLTATQMAYAVKDVGLEPYVVGAKNPHILNSTVYAYARGKIPTILGIDLIDVNGANRVPLGKHAVAVTGYSLSQSPPAPAGTTGFLLRAARIDKFYVHDDQVGPFARMEHRGNHLSTGWKGNGDVQAIPYLMMLPLYNKIRIPFSAIHDATLYFDQILEITKTQAGIQKDRIEWDIYLTTVNCFKSDFMESNDPLLNSSREDVLTTPLPRFLWRVSGRINDDMQIDLLFDATGIEQQQLIVLAVEYSDYVRSLTTLANRSGLIDSITQNAPLSPQTQGILDIISSNND